MIQFTRTRPAAALCCVTGQHAHAPLANHAPRRAHRRLLAMHLGPSCASRELVRSRKTHKCCSIVPTLLSNLSWHCALALTSMFDLWAPLNADSSSRRPCWGTTRRTSTPGRTGARPLTVELTVSRMADHARDGSLCSCTGLRLVASDNRTLRSQSDAPGEPGSCSLGSLLCGCIHYGRASLSSQST